MNNFTKIKNDRMFKAIFTKEENRDLLERLIYECTNLEVKIISIEANELRTNNINTKNKILDVLVKTKDEEINIEVNSYESSSLRRRNASYIFKRYSDGVYVGETYNDMLKYIQINLTSNLPSKKPIIDVYTLSNKHNENYINNLEIYEINLVKAMEECYNKSNLSVIGMLYMDEVALKEVKGDKLMEKLKTEAEKYFREAEPFLPPEIEEKLLINTLKADAKIEGHREGFNEGHEEGFNEGREEGFEQGIEQNTKDIVKRLLSENINDEIILKVTNITKEELSLLKNNSSE